MRALSMSVTCNDKSSLIRRPHAYAVCSSTRSRPGRAAANNCPTSSTLNTVGKRFGFLPRWQDNGLGGVTVRQRPGRACRVGDCQSRRQAKTAKPMRKIGEQHLLSAEQMSRAGHIEEKTVRAVLLAPRRDGWSVARGPQRKAFQRGIVGNGIGSMHLQHLGLCARIGQRIANCKSFGLRCRVQGGDARSAGGIDRKNKRSFRIDWLAKGAARLRCDKAQDRPTGQPD